MKPTNNILLTVLAVMLLVTGACSHRTTDTALTPGQTRGMGSEEFRYVYLEALRQQNAGHYDAAFDLLTHCLEIDSLAPEVYYELGVYYSDLGQDSMTNVCLKKAVALNPSNDAYHERLAQWYTQSNELDKAIAAYEKLYKTNHNRTDVLEMLWSLYQHEKDYDNMLLTLDRLEQVDGTSEKITLAKMQVYQAQGRKDAAFAALKNLSDEHPNDANYKVMMGNWLLQNDRKDEAREVFMQAQDDDPNNEYVAASLYDFYRQTGEDSLATIYRDKILMNRYTAPSTKSTILQQVVMANEQQGGDSTEVLRLMDRMLEASPEDVEVARLQVAYMQMKNMPDEDVEQALRKVLTIAPEEASARMQLIQLIWNKQDWHEIIDVCKPATEYNTDEMVFCYFLGIAYYQLDMNEEALVTMRRGVSRINENSNKEIVSDLYSMMGDMLYQKKLTEEAYAAYDSCLQWKPDNISCLNNYAYYLSENGGDLKKAEEMSKKTIVAEPTNATYLDTYAWILYLEERYMEAKEYIDRAMENCDPERDNKTIEEHADVIYKISLSPSK